MEDIKALTGCAECTWDYIDRLRMALASACKERDEARKELHEAKSELDAYRSTGVLPEDLKRAFNETAILKLAAQALSTTPDHIRDILQAEQTGRLVLLPREVGDTVYQIDAERVYESEVKWIIFDCDDIAFDERAIGGSVFLTREEAEAALAQEGGKGHA